jgi:hypothetical protein
MESEKGNAKETKEKRSKQYEINDPYTDEQIYVLWWKYLALSGPYKEFCEIMRTVTAKGTSRFYAQVEEAYKARHPDSATVYDDNYWYDHLMNWEFMGDVHAGAQRELFDKWWKGFRPKPALKRYSIINLTDPDAPQRLPRYIFALNKHYSKSSQHPAPDDVIKYFTSSREYVFLAIPITADLKTAMRGKIITELRKAATRKIAGNDPQILDYRYNKPYGLIKYTELQKYHDVYLAEEESHHDREKAKIKAGIHDASVFCKHLRIAENIIQNVEKGIFPGKNYWRK